MPTDLYIGTDTSLLEVKEVRGWVGSQKSNDTFTSAWSGTCQAAQ